MRSAADFVDGFRRFWAAPSLDGLPALLAPDVKLVQPLAPSCAVWAGGSCGAPAPRRRSFAGTGEGAIFDAALR